MYLSARSLFNNQGVKICYYVMLLKCLSNCVVVVVVVIVVVLNVVVVANMLVVSLLVSAPGFG